MPGLPPPAEIRARFEADGFFSPIQALSPGEARRCREALEAFERAHPDEIGLIDMKANLLFPWIDKVTRNPVILEALEPIIGKDVLCENVGFRNKPPNAKTFVSWHQDTVYLKFEPVVTTCWLALTPATVENGCLRIIPGSHKWGDLEHKEARNTDSMLTRGHYIATEFDQTRALDCVLEPGQALVIHTGIVHSSQPNRSTDRRMGMLLDYVPAWGKKLNGRESAMLVRGQDRWDHFDHETPPAVPFGADERARHRKAVELVTATFYAGSDRVPEALSGKTRHAL